MKTTRTLLCLITVVAVVAVTPTAFAQRQLGKKKGPTSKIYVAESNGESQILLDGKVHTARQATAFDAPGTVIETKEGANNTLVYSNGTGMFIDQKTRVEVNEFAQEPFRARNLGSADVPSEPSVSRSNVFVSRGAIGVCTPRLAAGSTMNYGTPEGGVNIRGGKVSIETNDNITVIDLLEGDATVRGGVKDAAGSILHPGERATIRPGPVGRPAIVTISQIPPDQLKTADDRVTVACNAKKTVTFEVIEKKASEDLTESDAAAAIATSEAKSDGAAAFGEVDIAGTGVDATAGSSSTSDVFNDGASNDGETTQVIVVKPVVPLQLPVNVQVSPDKLPGT